MHPAFLHIWKIYANPSDVVFSTIPLPSNAKRREDRIDGEDAEDNDGRNVLAILPRRKIDLVRIRRERIAARQRCELCRSPHDEDVEEEEYAVDVEEVQITKKELRDNVDDNVEGKADLCPHRRDILIEEPKENDDDKRDIVEAHILLQEIVEPRRCIDQQRCKTNGDKSDDNRGMKELESLQFSPMNCCGLKGIITDVLEATDIIR